MSLRLKSFFRSEKLFSYFLIFLVSLLFFTKANSQGTPNVLPTIIQPSPQSTAFTKYGEYPMASYTGLTDITIPLHTVTGKKLSLPITMSFHASGRMANEVNGTLGMRWTLNCGGLVTRTMKGLPDEWSSKTTYNANPNNTPSFEDLYSACPDGKIASWYQTVYDSEYDIFDYALPNGKQGHFILKDQNGVKEPMFIPYEALKVEYVTETTGRGYIQYITITDVDGTRYIFGSIDASSVNAIEKTPEPDKINGRLGDVTTAWYLTKIISADATDEISLSYTGRYVYSGNASQTETLYDRVRNSSTDFTMVNEDSYENYLFDLLQNNNHQWVATHAELENRFVPTLSSIQFFGGSVTLSYTTAAVSYNNVLLNEMIINREGTPYKKIKFNAVKHIWEPDIYYLRDLSFYGEDQNVVNEKYSFSYYDPEYIYQVDQLESAVIDKDWWGYYRPFVNKLMAYQQIQVTPVYSSPTPVFIGIAAPQEQPGWRDPNDGKKIGMLKAITYPTGGQTEFVYEANRYDYSQSYHPPENTATIEGPGLRIKEVISRPIQGKDIHKIYKYGIYEDGRGYINEYLRPDSWLRSQLMANEGNSMHFWEVGVGSLEQAGYRVRDYLPDPNINFDFAGSPIKYDAVSEYYVEDNVPQQKTQGRYRWGNQEQLNDFVVNDLYESITYARKYSDPQNAWLTPVMYNKVYYKYVDGRFDSVKREIYNYENIEKDEVWDMPTYLHTTVVNARPGGSGVAQASYNLAKQYHENSCSVYGYGYRKYKSGVQVVASTVTEEFTPQGTIKVEKDMTYDPTYCLLRSEDVINSKSEIARTTYSYPHDFPNTPVYQQMVQQHMLSPVVQTVTSNVTQGAQVKKAVTNYFNPASSIFVPQSIEIQNGSYSQEVAINFNKYDNLGNILEQQKANDIKEVYLWGYGYRYPVAKIIGNKGYDEINQIASPDITLLNTGTAEQVKTELQRISAILRAQPQLQVSTYTYKPLTGMTSETDPNNRTTYYEYDVFGRVKLVRDQDQNVLRRICYNYAGQAEACQLFYNQEKSQTFTRMNCGPGLTPGTYTYTVPAGKYAELSQTAADALADADITANGQQQANILGTCLYNSPDVSGYYTRSNCQGGDTPEPIYVYMPAGSYTSSVSVEDARQQALQAAQTYANWYGECRGKSEFRVFNDLSSEVALLFTNKVSNEEFYFYVDAYQYDVMVGLLPQGEYQVEIYGPWDYRYYYYFTANGESGNAIGEITVNTVLVNSGYNTFNISRY